MYRSTSNAQPPWIRSIAQAEKKTSQTAPRSKSRAKFEFFEKDEKENLRGSPGVNRKKIVFFLA